MSNAEVTSKFGIRNWVFDINKTSVNARQQRNKNAI